MFEDCWSDLIDGFGKADTERGSDASEKRNEDLHPRRILNDLLIVFALIHL